MGFLKNVLDPAGLFGGGDEEVEYIPLPSKKSILGNVSKQTAQSEQDAVRGMLQNDTSSTRSYTGTRIRDSALENYQRRAQGLAELEEPPVEEPTIMEPTKSTKKKRDPLKELGLYAAGINEGFAPSEIRQAFGGIGG